ncbi:MAG: hypothetical protein ACRETN_12760 [Nevskiales bacterium]
MKAIVHRTVLTCCTVMLLGIIGVAQAGYYHPYSGEFYSPSPTGYDYRYDAGYYQPYSPDYFAAYDGDYHSPYRSDYSPPYRAGLRGSSQEWEVICAHEDEKHNKRCVAYTALEGLVGGVWGAAHALSVSSNEPGDYRLGWTPRLYVPDGEHPLFLQVDNRYRRSFSAGKKGYRGNEFDGYRIETDAALINAMKRGRELSLSYTDIFGDTRQVRFSLMGVTRSLQMTDQRLTAKPKMVAPAQAPVARLYRHK